MRVQVRVCVRVRARACAHLFEVGGLLVLRHVEGLGLELAGEGDDGLSPVRLHPRMDLGQPLGLLADEGLLCQVHQVHRGLAGYEGVAVQELHVLIVPLSKPAEQYQEVSWSASKLNTESGRARQGRARRDKERRGNARQR